MCVCAGLGGWWSPSTVKAGNAVQVKSVRQKKHNMAFTAGRQLHKRELIKKKEAKKCTLLCPQLFQSNGNALKKNGSCCFCVCVHACVWVCVCECVALLSCLTPSQTEHRPRRSLPGSVCDACMDTQVSVNVYSGCLSPISMLLIVRLEAALSDQ